MEVFESLVDRAAAPPLLYSLAFAVFLIGLRSRALWSRAGGAVLGVLGLAFLATGLSDAGFRRLLLAPERLPVSVCMILSACGVWLAMHRIEGADSAAPAAGDRPRPPWRGPTAADAKAAVAAGLALMALAFVLEPPLAGPADLGGAELGGLPEPAKAPWPLVGLQELALYFDPRVAPWLLPGLFLLALLAWPWVEPRIGSQGSAPPRGRREALSIFLFGWIFLFLLPMLVGAFLRGPGWHAFGPFEPWEAARPAPRPPLPLSEVFWCRWLGRTAPPVHWLVRELPGIALVAVYFGLLPWRLSRWRATRVVFERYRKTLGRRRYTLGLALALALLFVPLKMYGRWLFDVGHWLWLPEISFGF